MTNFLYAQMPNRKGNQSKDVPSLEKTSKGATAGRKQAVAVQKPAPASCNTGYMNKSTKSYLE